MIKALDSYVIRGLNHNINFLRDCMTHPRFIAGRLSTGFIPVRLGRVTVGVGGIE